MTYSPPPSPRGFLRDATTRIISRTAVLLLLLGVAAPLAPEAQAQEAVQFVNRWKQSELIAVEESSAVANGSANNVWIVEPSDGEYVRLKNKATGLYLHTETGLSVGAAAPGWFSAMWELEPVEGGFVRIKNRWKETYLHNETGSLDIGEVSDGWFSAMWKQQPAPQISAPRSPQPSASASVVPAPTHVQDYEKSPQVSNLVEIVKGVSPPSSDVIEAEVDGFEDKYFADDEIRVDDHPSGITMTPRGRIVTTMSRTGSGSTCGVLLYSDPYVKGRDITWNSECVLEKHPSAIQAVGEIVAVAQGSSIKFFLLPTDGQPFRELSHLTRLTSSVEAVGVAYNAGNESFYLFYSGGDVTPPSSGSIPTSTLCNTQRGSSLLNPSTQFANCRTVPNVKASGQGAHLITQSDGKMYVVSTFSSTEDPDKLRDGSKCFDDFLGFSDGDFLDIVTVTYLESTSGGLQGREAFSATLGSTQSQCIVNRPSWRYGGGIAPTSGNELIALWAGRLFTEVVVAQADLHLGFTDDFEIAVQTVSEHVTRKAASNESCSSNGDCANGACGRPHANDAPLLCCPSGRTVNHAGYDYCTGMPNGTACWLDSMCTNDSCSGNLYGARRGTCD